MTELLSRNPAGAVTAADPRDGAVRELLFTMLRSLVDATEQLELIHVTGADGVAFQARSAPNDVAKLIGKNGRTGRAIRTILGAIAAKNKRKYTLDIAQPSSQV